MPVLMVVACWKGFGVVIAAYFMCRLAIAHQYFILGGPRTIPLSHGSQQIVTRWSRKLVFLLVPKFFSPSIAHRFRVMG
jgi:hypothetical protein